MPSFETAKRILSVQTNNAKTIGQIHKENSDFIMEQTWDDDIQSRKCFIYDYIHDDSPTLKDHITHTDDTTKTMIDAKFIISSYGSMDKDQVAYHILFKPSQKIDFEEGDDLYYYETDYKQKYGVHSFIGLYLDIPDDKGIYYRWLICDYEEANQFVKYVVLPCDYRFEWVQIIGGKKYIRKMWGCTRAQNSYTSGIYTDRYFTSLDNVDKFILPMNNITETFGYNDHLGSAQRIIISAKVPHPSTWQVSKIETTKPIGLLKVTIKQVPFNDDTDYIEYNDDGNIVSMLADYYSADLSDPVENDPQPVPSEDVVTTVISSSPTIKIGSSYRTITAKYTYEGSDVSEQCKQYDHIWRCYIDDKRSTPVGDDIVTIKITDDPNVIKIKFANNNEYIGKRLYVYVNTNVHWHGWSDPISIIG